MTSAVPHHSRWGEPFDPEEAARLAEMTKKRAIELQEEFELDDFKPLDPAELTSTSERFRNPPPPRDYLIKGVLPSKVVAAVIAIGGVGKGYLMIMLGLALATIKKIGPLEPTRKFKVIYLSVEDDQDELDRRMTYTVGAIWPEEPPKEIDNYIGISIRGKNLGPLMMLDQAKNPVIAPAYDWLCKTLEKFQDVDVLILDPKSKFYGLDENNNTHCAAWVNCLESLVARFKITVLFLHHESKALAGSMSQASSRGGSALTDGCRWVANIKTMDRETAKNFQIADPRNYVVMDVTKSNYAPKLPEPIYFRRGAGGALTHVDLAAERIRIIAEGLLDGLAAESAKGRHFSRRDLLYMDEPKHIIDSIKKTVTGFNRVRDIGWAVDQLLEHGWLKEAPARKAKTGPEKLILQVVGTAD
ncbi:MAG: AAA family ATPase [Deltaproteobacteria bacterium]|nr:AAA family ATPase [Deltaproteobacteria bacterium]